MRAAFSQ
jgi:hypothetical protein